MIKKLRTRFILIAMLSVFIVLGTIITSINVINFSKVNRNADEILNILSQNEGKFDGMIDEQHNDSVRPETPFKTRYFTAKYDGEILVINTDNVVAITDSQALEMAQNVLDSGRTSGNSGIYRYLVTSDGLAIFIDCETELNSAYAFLRSSIIVSAVGLLAVFLLVFVLSKYALMPVAESYRKQKEFITNATHELKTPLTIISLNNEMVEMTAGQSESTDNIAKQVDRLTKMVKNMTALAKLDEGISLQSSQISLSNLAEEMVQTFQDNLQSNNRKFDFEIADNIAISGDSNLIKNLLSILFENSAKYAKSQTHFKLENIDKKAVLTISNDADVEEGNLDKCFERFYRTAQSRGSGIEGSGIGLSVAKEIVNLHHGKIMAYGENGNFIIKVILK